MELDLNFLGSGGLRATDVDTWSKLAALLDGLVELVVLELYFLSLLIGFAIIDGSVGHLIKDVVESWCPLSGSPLGGEGAVVNHVSDTLVVHVWGKRIDGLDDGCSE